MAFDYSGLEAVAAQLIADFGRGVTLQRASQTPEDPNKPWGDVEPKVSALDFETFPALAVFLEPRREDREASSVKTVQHRVLVAARDLPTRLDTTWQVKDGTVLYETVRAEPLEPGDTLLFYDLLVRL